jgi:prevent-host-death family protein
MTETRMSASDFRVHLKDVANSVSEGGLAVTVERHGSPMFAVVSLEDLEFLRRTKYGGPQKPRPETITLIHPDAMPIDLVEEAYGLTNGTTDFELIGWRQRAYLSMSLRRRTRPEVPP